MFFSKQKKEALTVHGMSCSHCEQAVEKGVGGLPGVTKVKADHQKDRVEVFYKDAPPDMQVVQEKIADLGYEPADA